MKKIIGEERQWKAEKIDKGDVFLDYDPELELWILIGTKSKFCYNAYSKEQKKEALNAMYSIQRRCRKNKFK
jgi:hypothetical protein